MSIQANMNKLLSQAAIGIKLFGPSKKADTEESVPAAEKSKVEQKAQREQTEYQTQMREQSKGLEERKAFLNDVWGLNEQEGGKK